MRRHNNYIPMAIISQMIDVCITNPIDQAIARHAFYIIREKSSRITYYNVCHTMVLAIMLDEDDVLDTIIAWSKT